MVKIKISEISGRVENEKNNIEKYQKFSKRIIKKPEKDYLSNIITETIKMFNEKIEQMELAILQLRQAEKEILKDYGFEIEEESGFGKFTVTGSWY